MLDQLPILRKLLSVAGANRALVFTGTLSADTPHARNNMLPYPHPFLVQQQLIEPKQCIVDNSCLYASRESPLTTRRVSVTVILAARGSSGARVYMESVK